MFAIIANITYLLICIHIIGMSIFFTIYDTSRSKVNFLSAGQIKDFVVCSVMYI